MTHVEHRNVTKERARLFKHPPFKLPLSYNQPRDYTVLLLSAKKDARLFF